MPGVIPPAHAKPPVRTAAGTSSLVLGILGAVPLGAFFGAQVLAAATTTVADTLFWGATVTNLAFASIAVGSPLCALAIAIGVVAVIRNGRIGRGLGLAGTLLGAVVLVWEAIAVVPLLMGAGLYF